MGSEGGGKTTFHREETVYRFPRIRALGKGSLRGKRGGGGKWDPCIVKRKGVGGGKDLFVRGVGGGKQKGGELGGKKKRRK